MIEGPLYQQAALCEPVLRALPDWFGIESAIRNYVVEIDTLPTLFAKVGENVAGFLTLKQHSPYAAEVYVMGLYPQYHRQGLGRDLVKAAEALLAEQGVEYLQVKTLSPSVEDAHYAQTRAFYEAMGFRPLEEIRQIWGEENPCLIMVKYLHP
jgi:ribosomal protein S18 acetylase RimI-like enzyme